MTLRELISATRPDSPALKATISCQLSIIREGTTRAGKPFLDIALADATATEKIKIWQDSAPYDDAYNLEDGAAVMMAAHWSRNQFGLNHDHLELRLLTAEERKELMLGPRERVEQLERDWEFLTNSISQTSDPRLRLLCEKFLEKFGERFQRVAAARDYHHARRGGLLEHTSQMLRAAESLSGVYPGINLDLLRAGVLFHDCGKLWENDIEPEGFAPKVSTLGELLGHISIGIEVVNALWNELEQDEGETGQLFRIDGAPHRRKVREHLLHLIASHHGAREFGAPVTPRTPEAWMLHYVDNLDAKSEMLRAAYEENGQIAPGIYEPRRPLSGHPIQPLISWEAGAFEEDLFTREASPDAGE